MTSQDIDSPLPSPTILTVIESMDFPNGERQSSLLPDIDAQDWYQNREMYEHFDVDEVQITAHYGAQQTTPLDLSTRNVQPSTSATSVDAAATTTTKRKFTMDNHQTLMSLTKKPRCVDEMVFHNWLNFEQAIC